MNHKRGRAKNRRAGCLFCKPHKANGAGQGALTVQDRRAPDVDSEIVNFEVDGSKYRPDPPDAAFEYLAAISDEWAWECW